MPYALVTIGLLMIITGINNTYSPFAAQLQSDFTGSKSFFVWIIAIGSVGALGYINNLRQFSHYFMALILIALILSNKGVFANFQAAIASGPKQPVANSTSGTSASSTTDTNSATTPNQGPFGSTPQSAGENKAFGWFNYLFGFSNSGQ